MKNTWTILVDILKNKKKSKLPDYFNIDGHMSNDSTLIANEFYNYFANIGQSLSNSIKQPKKDHLKSIWKIHQRVNWHLKTLAREIHWK